jgi:hypothetical protein
MQVIRTIPEVARLPEVLVFYCDGCGELETRERGRAAARRAPASGRSRILGRIPPRRMAIATIRSVVALGSVPERIGDLTCKGPDNYSGVRRGCKSKVRLLQLCLSGRWHGDANERGTVSHKSRHRRGACSVEKWP